MCQVNGSLSRLIMALGVLILITAPSMADTFTYSSVTSPESDVFLRPVETGDAFSPLIDEFGFPVLVQYSDFHFSVDLGGLYTFTSQQFGFDGFLILYQERFDPKNSLLNFVRASDDDPNFGRGFSSFTASLSQSLQYFLVTAGFDSPDYGRFTNQIIGPGRVDPIPEPATMLLLGTGLAGGLIELKRRRKKEAVGT